MKNRAKCKLCNSIIESFYEKDVVSCKCGEIVIYGGDYYLGAQANDFSNFLRVDDEGNEILVKYVEKSTKNTEETDKKEEIPPKMTKKEKINELKSMIKNIQDLPSHAMTLPINHYDFCSFMLLMVSILDED